MTNLYPPVIDTYMPAFVMIKDNDISSTFCDIYFSLSDYNALSEIGSIWISVSNQHTNTSVLSTQTYPTGLKKVGIEEVGIDNSRPGSDKYRVRIYGNELQDGWHVNEIYKVQLRFCSKAAVENKMYDILKNQDYFSEWSKICLIQGILSPKLEFMNFDSSGNEVSLTTIGNSLIGTFTSENTDNLESYKITIFKVGESSPCFESEILYTDYYNPNTINYDLKYVFENQVHYELRVDYTTEKMYSSYQVFYFYINNENNSEFDAQIKIYPEGTLGRIRINAITEDSMFGNLIIRRASNKSNYKIWEDVHIANLTGDGPLDYTWYDYTIESGTWYQYAIQKVNSINSRSQSVIAKTPVMVIFDDMFLVGESKQLNIKFNPQISSFSQTVVDSSIQTIGSKYPFIRRNAHVNYKQFAISGLISALGDQEEYYTENSSWQPEAFVSTFASKEDCYGAAAEDYEKYNQDNRINEYNDFTFEREFRNKVMEFLYDGKIKLFKSASEGNVLVRLMNISLTPNQQLGRMLYTFNATAYEIGPCTLENFDKYNIQTIGELTKKLIRTEEKESVYEIPYENKNINLIKFLQQKENNNYITDDNTAVEIAAIKGFTLELDPQAAYSIDLEKMQPKSSQTANDFKGFLVEVNGMKHIISSAGYYHVESSEAEINDLIIYLAHEPNENIGMTLFKVSYLTNIVENPEQTLSNTQSSVRRGQYLDNVASLQNLNIIDRIVAQKNQDYGVHYEKASNIHSLTINAPVGSIFNINGNERIVGEGDLLDLSEDDTMITSLSLEVPNSAPSATVYIDYKYDLLKGWRNNEEV